MPSERAIVETLNRKELRDLVDHFDLEVEDRRIKDNLIDALASSRRTRLDDILGQLPLASLKEVCRKHNLDDAGRSKGTLIERILAGNARQSKKLRAAALEAAKPGSKKKTAKKVKAPVVAAKTSGKASKALVVKPSKPATGKTAQAKIKVVKAAAQAAEVAEVIPMPRPAAPVVVKAKAAAAPAVAAKPQPAPVPPPQPLPMPWSVMPDPLLMNPDPVACKSCGQEVQLRKYQVQRCKNLLVPHPARKICAECLFERNTLSMTDFDERLQEELQCPHCSAAYK